MDPDWGKADPDPHHCNVGTYCLHYAKSRAGDPEPLEKTRSRSRQKYEAPVPAHRR